MKIKLISKEIIILTLLCNIFYALSTELNTMRWNSEEIFLSNSFKKKRKKKEHLSLKKKCNCKIHYETHASLMSMNNSKKNKN